MSDEGKPKASFLGGKKAAAAPASPPAEQPSPSPAPSPAPAGGKPGFLRGGPAAAPASPAPAAVAAPAPVAAPKPVVVAAPAAAAAPAAPVQGNRALAQQYLDRGLNHYDRQEIDEAYNAYQQCVQADPGFHLGYNNLGMVLIDLERYEEALEALFNSVRCDPDYGEAYNNLGFVLRRVQRSIEAASAYGMYLKLEPDVEEAPRIQGWMQTVMQENNLAQLPPFVVPPKAGQEAAPAPASAPAPAEPQKIKKMAAWEVAAGDVATAAPVSALGDIETEPAPEAAPAAPVAAAVPAVFARPAAAPAKPATVAPKAAPPTVQPARAGGMKPPGASGIVGKSTAVVEKGMDQFAEGKLDEAAKFFTQATEIEPANPEGHIGLAKVWLRQERTEEAIELLRKAVELDPKEPAGYYVLGFALRSLDRSIEAIEAYDAFLKLMPDAVDAVKMNQWVSQVRNSAGLSNAQDDVEDTEELVTDFDQQYKAALDTFRGGDVDTALRESIRILTEDPGHARTRVLLGRCYLRQKAFDQAFEQFENSLVSRPDYPEALYFLGQAAERKANREKAIESYNRYLEVAPDGPRAERLHAWIEAQGGAGATDPNQQQCELCLRYFSKNDITLNEGKATCRNCMAVMGGGGELDPSLQDPATMGRILPALHDEEEEPEEEAPKKKGKGVLVLGAFGLIAAGVAVMFYLGKLNPVLEKLGLIKKPVIKKNIDPGKIDPIIPEVTFDPTQVKFAANSQAAVLPYTAWTYKPALEGLNTLDKYAPGWTKEFSIKNEPKGMTIDAATGEIKWSYSPDDYKALKNGKVFKVELSAKATGKGPDGASRELFNVVRPISLFCQLGYELGPEIELGLGSGEKPSLGVGEFNGDDLSDLVIASGRFRAGSLREYVQRKDNPLPVPTVLMRDSRFSALQVSDLDGDKKDDLIAADWQRGRLRLFYQQANELIRKDEIPIGAGPIALGAGDMDGDKKPEVAALLGAGGALAITSINAEGKFGNVSTIKMSGVGGRGFVLPWNSAKAGPGFVAITPLAQHPIQFVAWNKGEWDKSGSGPIKSSLEEGSVITDVCVVNSSGGAKQLALIVSGRNNQVMLMQENGGQFSAADTSVALPGIGLGLASHDFNRDGRDDLLVVMAEEIQMFLSHGNQYEPAVHVQKTPRMLGPVVRFGRTGAERPDFLLVSETRKAHILKALIVEPPAEPTPAPEVKKEVEASPVPPTPLVEDTKTTVPPAKAAPAKMSPK